MRISATGTLRGVCRASEGTQAKFSKQRGDGAKVETPVRFNDNTKRRLNRVTPMLRIQLQRQNFSLRSQICVTQQLMAKSSC
jgi:hypothetical protein